MNDRALGNLGTAMVQSMSPGQRWESMPRPLKYVRPRLYPEDAEYLRSLLEAEQGDRERDLTDLRVEGKNEDDELVQSCRSDLTHLASIIREVSLGIIEFAGPKEG